MSVQILKPEHPWTCWNTLRSEHFGERHFQYQLYTLKVYTFSRALPKEPLAPREWFRGFRPHGPLGGRAVLVSKRCAPAPRSQSKLLGKHGGPNFSSSRLSLGKLFFLVPWTLPVISYALWAVSRGRAVPSVRAPLQHGVEDVLAGAGEQLAEPCARGGPCARSHGAVGPSRSQGMERVKLDLQRL